MIQDDPSKNERLFVSHAWRVCVFSRLWWKSSVSGARGHRRLCHFSCSVKVNFSRHNLAKLRKKRELLFSQTPSEKKTGLATCEWPSISLRQALATSTRRCGQMRGKFDRHLYCCTEADLAVRSESALRPPYFFCSLPPSTVDSISYVLFFVWKNKITRLSDSLQIFWRALLWSHLFPTVWMSSLAQNIMAFLSTRLSLSCIFGRFERKIENKKYT